MMTMQNSIGPIMCCIRASDSFSSTALYKSIYLLTYLLTYILKVTHAQPVIAIDHCL